MIIAATPPLRLSVTQRRELTAEVIELTLRSADGSPLPSWQPGAHIELQLEGAVARQYSLTGMPSLEEWTIAVLREPAGRGGSVLLHETVREGARISAVGPRNHFEMRPEGTYRFLAGGIGITPLLPMIRAAAAAGADWTLTYVGRSRSTMAYLPELLEQHGDKISVHAADENNRIDLQNWLSSSDAAVYACGPARLLDALDAHTSKWPEGRLRVERFTPRATHPPQGDDAFDVEFASSGRTAHVEAGESILDVAEANGIFVLSSCREGTCGTCETPILAGEADHRDSVLSRAQQNQQRAMMICVSRASCPKLVLDL